MMTRTLGTVSGATVLMLLFQTWRNSALAGGASDPAAFLAAFGFTFQPHLTRNAQWVQFSILP
jgi:hypothetical protein